MPSLVIKAGPHEGHRYPLHGETEVGRERSAGIRVEDRTISRRHATVSVRDGRVFVTDLGSQNGTAVNGLRIRKETALKDGDEVRFGNILMAFHAGRLETPGALDSSSVRLEDRPQTVLVELKAADLAASILSGEGKVTIETVKRRLGLLQDVSVALHRAKNEEELCGLILDQLLEVFPAADRGFLLLHDPVRGELRPAAVRVRPGIPGEIAISRTLVWDVLRKKRGVVSSDAMEDTRFRRVSTLVQAGIRSVVCVPMVMEGESSGVIALDSLRSSGRFVTDDMALLGAIAAQAALALSVIRLHGQLLDHELMERDLALARRIQTRFLPHRLPEIPGWEFRGHYEPALDVGGDYYDCLELSDGRIGIGIGDVSGKGVSAALYMVHLRTAVRTHAPGASDPAEVLGRVNRALIPDLDEGMFVTCAFAILEPASGRFRVASAGHPPPLLRRRDGSVAEMTLPRSSPLGINEQVAFASRVFSIGPGETVILYTDGVSEATDSHDVLFGTQRLADAVASAPGSSETVEKAVLDAVSAFVGGAPQADDLTLVCFGSRG